MNTSSTRTPKQAPACRVHSGPSLQRALCCCCCNCYRRCALFILGVEGALLAGMRSGCSTREPINTLSGIKHNAGHYLQPTTRSAV